MAGEKERTPLLHDDDDGKPGEILVVRENEVYGTFGQRERIPPPRKIRGDGGPEYEVESITLAWRDIIVTTTQGRRNDHEVKRILRNVSGLVKSGTLLAILGASGAGKSTLLNVLTHKIRGKMDISGDVLVNGKQMGNEISNISAYVQQDDLFVGTLSVREHLVFRALLRMDKSLSKADRLRRVEEVIQEMGLMDCANNIIGTPGRIKGISGGEMKRLSFASEIITNPPILFCDEPTSGLDSYMAQNVVSTLKSLASKGRAIMCTIHQPSSQVFAMFDEILLLAEGRVAFMGTASEAITYFSKNGYDCPLNFNPADFYLQILALIPGRETECKKVVESICDRFASSGKNQAMAEEIRKMTNPESNVDVKSSFLKEDKQQFRASWCRQMRTVLWRSWLSNIRDPASLRMRGLQSILIAIVLGLIYLQQPYNQTGVMNINGVLFIFLTNMSFVNMFTIINVLPLELPVFTREHGSRLYRVDVYFLCKTFADIPFFIIFPFIFASIAYWMVGLYNDVYHFLIAAAVIIIIANVAGSFGFLISAVTQSVNVALAAGPPLMIPLLLFGGFFLNNISVPDYFIWLKYLSWFKYGMEILAINQWYYVTTIDCPMPFNRTSPFAANVSTKCLNSGKDVLEYLAFEKDNYYLDIGLLFALIFAFRFLAFIALLFRSRKN